MSTGGAWWDSFAEAGGMDQLQLWLGGVDAPSRLRIRQRIAECQYESVLDCGAGIGLDWVGMKNLSHTVEYAGIEPSAELRKAAITNATEFGHEVSPEIIEGTIEQIPYEDERFDLVYARHILEHLPKIEQPLNEMIRVARLEMIVVFFMRPGAETYLTRERDGLWQNWWGKGAIDEILHANPKVEVWFYETLDSEVLLHAYLNAAISVDPARVAERMER